MSRSFMRRAFARLAVAHPPVDRWRALGLRYRQRQTDHRIVLAEMRAPHQRGRLGCKAQHSLHFNLQ
ncbi:MAG: hypothetical protein ABI575_09900, partial [Oxalobacteraceae bacterium]